jgi:hypothetical protein
MPEVMLVLGAAAIFVVPAIFRLIRQLVELLVKMIAAAFTVMFILLVLTAFVAHGKL